MVFLHNNICKISNFKLIKLISNSKIEIIINKRLLIINGVNLAMSFYSKEEITIKGKVDKIEFYDNI